jgi:chromosome segregation ATPase
MVVEVKPGQHVTVDNLRELIDTYETRKELTDELESLHTRAQKGKIPRRQYKVQKRAIEIRVEGLTRNIERTKAILRGSSSAYADLAKQLDSAEADLAEAEENIRILELRQSKGELTLEYYKRNISEYQKRRDKAESGINGIMLRLREKTR